MSYDIVAGELSVHCSHMHGVTSFRGRPLGGDKPT